jgi:hypothetical protein
MISTKFLMSRGRRRSTGLSEETNEIIMCHEGFFDSYGGRGFRVLVLYEQRCKKGQGITLNVYC